MSLLDECLSVADSLHDELARGWNTWDTRSVLSHVLLPEGLCVRLGFAAPDRLSWLSGDVFPCRRYAGRTPGTLLTSMDKQLPAGDSISVLPGLHAYDGSYTQLEVNLRGARFEVQTTTRGDDWCALVRPLQDEPWTRVLTIEAEVLWNRPGRIDPKDDRQLMASLEDRDVPIYVTGPPHVDPNLPARSPYMAVRLDQPIVISANKRVEVQDAEVMISEARKQHLSTFDVSGELHTAHEAMQSCLAWNVIYEPRFDRVICTVARDWNCIRGGYAVFCWDGFLMSWMIGRDAPKLAYANLLEMFREMVNDSFVPNIVQGTGRSSRDRSQPPVGGLCLLALYRDHPNERALRAAWGPMLAWNRWWHDKRRNKRGTLSPGSEPFKPLIGDPAEFVQPASAAGAALESGLDNSPVYDGATFDPITNHMPIEDVGLTSLYVVDCESLSQIAMTIGHDKEAAELQARAESYRESLRGLWYDEQGIFMNRSLDRQNWPDATTLTSFYPLLAGAATEEQIDRIVQEQMLNPDRFHSQWMVPASPRSEKSFTEQLYLRGRIWPPFNFLVYLAFKRCGRDKVCNLIADKSLEMLIDNWRKENVVAENYSALDGKGGREDHSHPLHGWGGLLAMTGLIDKGYAQMPLESLDLRKHVMG